MSKATIEHLHMIEVSCREILAAAGSNHTVPLPVATRVTKHIEVIRHALKEAGLAGPDKHGRLFTRKYYNKQKWIKTPNDRN